MTAPGDLIAEINAAIGWIGQSKHYTGSVALKSAEAALVKARTEICALRGARELPVPRSPEAILGANVPELEAGTVDRRPGEVSLGVIGVDGFGRDTPGAAFVPFTEARAFAMKILGAARAAEDAIAAKAGR